MRWTGTLRALVPLLSLHFVDTCIRTVPSTGCAGCSTDDITFTPAQGNRTGSIDSSFSGPTTSADGCIHLTAICNGDDGFVSFMQFNYEQGGPVENQLMEQVTTAPLDCRDGWIRTESRAGAAQLDVVKFRVPRDDQLSRSLDLATEDFNLVVPFLDRCLA
ncbi:unnamed protein product, partial [Mesorhabditis spiculigera]